MTIPIRHDWTTEEIQTLLELPLMDLLWQAQTVHRDANPGYRVQLASPLEREDRRMRRGLLLLLAIDP